MRARAGLALTVLAVACLVAAATSTAAVRVVHRGQLVRLAQSFEPSNTGFCLAEVTYADSTIWDSPVKRVSGGSVAWTFRIPRKATLGPATWSIRCGPVWHHDGRWIVARALPPS